MLGTWFSTKLYDFTTLIKDDFHYDSYWQHPSCSQNNQRIPSLISCVGCYPHHIYPMLRNLRKKPLSRQRSNVNRLQWSIFRYTIRTFRNNGGLLNHSNHWRKAIDWATPPFILTIITAEMISTSKWYEVLSKWNVNPCEDVSFANFTPP